MSSLSEFVGHGPQVQSTADAWQVDGVPLNTYAMAVTTRGHGRMGVPPVRGSNSVRPGIAGQTWQPKTPDAREMTLSMWVLGAAQDGRIADTAAFHRNYRALQRLFWRPGELYPISKRIQVADTAALDGWAELWVTAQCEWSGGFDPDLTGPSRAEFDVTITLPDPFFYDATTDRVFYGDSASTPGGSAGRCIVRNRGDYLADAQVFMPYDTTATAWPNATDTGTSSQAQHLAAGHTQLVTADVAVPQMRSGVWLRRASYPGGTLVGWDTVDVTGDWTARRFSSTSGSSDATPSVPDSRTWPASPQPLFGGRIVGSPSQQLIEVPRDVDTTAGAGTRVLLPGASGSITRMAVAIREKFL